MKKSFWLLLCFGLGFDPQVFSTSPGDREVATRFAHYLESGKGCSPTNNGPRVIISGFGLWAHQSLNLSGLVIDHLAADDSASTDRSGALARDEDVRIRNRTFRLQNGQEISACLILVNVMWGFCGCRGGQRNESLSTGCRYHDRSQFKSLSGSRRIQVCGF